MAEEYQPYAASPRKALLLDAMLALVEGRLESCIHAAWSKVHGFAPGVDGLVRQNVETLNGSFSSWVLEVSNSRTLLIC